MSAPVIAPPDTARCGERNPESGAYCERPEGHDGGHLSQTRNRYWQALTLAAPPKEGS